MNKKIVGLLTTAALMLPTLASAIDFTPPSGNWAPSPALIVTGVLSFIWPIVVGIVIIMFIVAGIMFLTAQGEPGKVAQARQFVIWGVVGVIVILLAFSVVLIVRNAFNIS